MCTDEFRLSTDFVAVNNNLIVARHFQCIIAGQIVDNAHRVPLIAHVAVNYAYINSLVRLNFETNSISQSPSSRSMSQKIHSCRGNKGRSLLV